MKDSRSLLLILLSVSLISTWVYHLYDKNNYARRTREIYIKDSIAVAEAVSDSLRKYFSARITRLNEEKFTIQTTNKNLKKELDDQLEKINALRAEISQILSRKDLTESDLKEARSKVRELQASIGNLESENQDLSQEKIRMLGQVELLNTEIAALQLSMTKISGMNEQLTQQVHEASVFIASEAVLEAFQSRGERKEKVTSQARKAEKFVASFSVKNNISDYPNAEVVVVITEPSGKVLTGEIWDSGTFETVNDGRKRFTRKIRFEYTKKEHKKVVFSIEPEAFEKGSYKLAVYHKGYKISEAACKLD